MMPAVLHERSFLARRLWVAVAVPLALLLGLGAFLGWQLLEVSEDARRLDHSDHVLAEANKTLLQIIYQESAVRGYLLSADRRFLDPYHRARAREGFDRLRELTTGDPAQAARFERARKQYERWLDIVVPLLEEANIEPGRTYPSMLERRDRMNAIHADMRTAIEVEEKLRQTLSAVSQASTERTKLVFVSLVISVALLLAVLSRRQLGSIASVFSRALAEEKAARESLEAEAWIRSGYARLSSSLQGEQTLEQLASECLSALLELTHADAAAFFAREGQRFRLRAGVAVDSKGEAFASFEEGEGLIGRAAASGETIELRDVKPEFLTLRSSAAAIAPAHVVIVPAQVENDTLAVVELGFLRPAEDRVLALLERVREAIALATRSAAYKARLRELLEETERQAEELQSQQEELRVQNEELEQQSRALMDSKGRLENQQAELEQINSELVTQTEALQRQREDLLQTQTELRRANEYKSEFLANMSHELRTPLNSSLILAKLLFENREGNLSSEQVKFAETIYSAGNDLLTLINDILDLSKIEAGKLDVKPESLLLRRVLDELSDTFAPVARDKHLQFSIELLNEAPQTIDTDPTRLSQILKNLLSNAFKFTEVGGVELTVRRSTDGGVAFDVKDTGIGVAKEQQEIIFEAFRQADGTTNRKYGGTGLGLSISRDLAQLLGGDLLVDSAPGRGSTFTLVLPERHHPESASAPPKAARARLPEAPPSRPQQSPLPAADAGEALPRGARSLLVIEDDAAFARVLADLARELDFDVLSATTAEEGLSLAERHTPSAIVLDVGLPDRSGLSVLDALKRNSSTRHIPVHMVSVMDHARTALEMGAAGYAIKPVARERLLEALKRLESKFTRRVRHVLVVEDDAVHRDSTCRLLAGGNVETIAVGTAAEALAKLETQTFDCMVLDLSLPDRSGFELLEEMSSQERYGFPPVIVYTGRNLSRDEEHQLRRFSQSIIVKGARSPERLLDEVTLFLHQVESELPPDRQRMLRDARHRDTVFEGRRILVVEDDVRNVFALTSVLESRGARVEIARNGKEALARLRDKPASDLVLMDIMMPEMDGLEAMREIRKRPELQKLPIIALTAKAMADDRESCLAAGANDYIAKPLDVDKLLSLVRVWMPK